MKTMSLLPADGYKVATVRCGRCRSERRREPCQLGVLWQVPGGALSWIYFDKRRESTGRKRSSPRGFHVLRHPAFSRLDGTDRLGALCTHHGFGYVSTADLTKARGNVFLDLMATA